MGKILLKEPNQVTIAIIDDEPDFLNLSKVVLKRFNDNYFFLSFQSPKEFLEHFQRGSVDIIISDYNMPEMTGFDLLKAVKKTKERRNINEEIPFILVTAQNRDEIKKKAFDLGIDYFVSKTVNSEILFMEINHFLKHVTNKLMIAHQLSELNKVFNALINLSSMGIKKIEDFQKLK